MVATTTPFYTKNKYIERFFSGFVDTGQM